MNGNTYDVVIIGGGVIGSSIARALSKYECRTVLLEKEEDVCSGTSKANSAIVHAGYDAKTGSLKAKLNVKGNAMMGDLSKELDFDFSCQVFSHNAFGLLSEKSLNEWFQLWQENFLNYYAQQSYTVSVSFD